MSPPNRQDVPQISQELGIHRSTLYQWRSNWRLQGEVVPASEKDPDSWSAADKFTVVLETAGFNATELSSYCRERGLFTEQVDRWRQTAQDANANAVLTMAEQRDLEKRHQQDQKEIKALKQDLRRKEKALAEGIAAGARESVLAMLMGVGLTMLQRWRRQFAGDKDGDDRRKGSSRHVSHRLSAEECQRILLTCNEPKYASLPPGLI